MSAAATDAAAMTVERSIVECVSYIASSERLKNCLIRRVSRSERVSDIDDCKYLNIFRSDIVERATPIVTNKTIETMLAILIGK